LKNKFPLSFTSRNIKERRFSSEQGREGATVAKEKLITKRGGGAKKGGRFFGYTRRKGFF